VQRHNYSPFEKLEIVTKTDTSYFFLLLHFLQQLCRSQAKIRYGRHYSGKQQILMVAVNYGANVYLHHIYIKKPEGL